MPNRLLLLSIFFILVAPCFVDYKDASLQCYEFFGKHKYKVAKNHCELAVQNGDTESQFKLAINFA
jgi:hypothetical protein